MAQTPRWGHRYPLGTDTPDVPLWMQNLATDLDDVAKDDQGILEARPVSTAGTPGKRGRYYYATDTGQLFRDHGTGWHEIPLGTVPFAHVYGTTTQLDEGGGFEDILWPSELEDTHGLHSTASNTARLTAPLAGLYVASFNADSLTLISNTRVDFRIVKGEANRVLAQCSASSATDTPNLSAPVRLAAGEYVKAQGQLVGGQGASGSLDSGQGTYLALLRVGA
jgi:hypothetical protein